ncbi:DUF2218 domain-containing protein [Labrys wisconsinensis]|uniref:DUF2218 domain-containing protein n=1 Tax=Labrys wisconsinensis TaxID=425677 RepID=A0ABU0J5B9_9HYPH|nr:DUF2218 domain-containing protein [Labrys wisconsinensis]MDQ0468658.1 hypothetical protein [Labrys wisconsinensis]
MTDTPSALRSAADVATPNASRHLQQLCKHFGHRRPVTFDEHAGRIGFEIGDCDLAAADGVLHIALASPGEEQMAQLQDVVARHLLRFAFREELQIDWRPA